MKAVHRVHPGVAAALVAVITLGTLTPQAQASSSNRDPAWTTIPGPTSEATGDAGRRMLYVGVWDSQRNRAVIFGGHPQVLNDTWTLDANGTSWQQLTTAGTRPSPRYGSYGVYDAANDRLIVFGGIDGYDNLLSDVWALSFSGTPTWSQLSPAGTPPSGRYYGATVYDPVNQRLVIFGGYDGSFTGDTWQLSLGATPTWSQISSSGPPGRDLTKAIYDPVRQRMVMYGGWTGSQYLGDVWALSLGGAPSWSQVNTTNTPSPRRENTMIYDPVGDRVVIFGGLQDPLAQNPLLTTYSLSLTTNAWTAIPTASPVTGRTALDAFYDPLHQRMITYGGYGFDAEAGLTRNYLKQTLQLTLSGTPTWSEVGSFTPGSPSARREYCAAYDPDHHQMVIFSGQGPGPRGPDTWVLPLSGDPTWSPVITAVSPNPRHGHIAVWDTPRHRMLFYGGYDDYSLIYASDLWQLTLGPTPEWTQLFPTGAGPGGRMFYGAIYDPIRDRLLLMGGHPQFNNDLYELPLSGPNELKWNRLFPTGTLPTPRWGHTMFYDPVDDRAIIYGGTPAYGQALGDVWALPLSGGPLQWQLVTPTGNAPDARLLYASVYDAPEDRWVLYGGANYQKFHSDIWELQFRNVNRTNPKWQKLKASGPDPGDRDLITSVYDPQRRRLVFFGGYDDTPSHFFNDTWFLNLTKTSVYSTIAGEEDGGTIVDKPGAIALPSDGMITEVMLESAIYAPESREFMVDFALPASQAVRMKVLDISGRVVAVRDLGIQNAGRHQDSFRASALPSGMYFMRFDAGAIHKTRKVLVVQ